MPSDFVSQYQAKMDRDFPAGAIAAWQGDSAVYLTPRILVTGQRGLDPEIFLPVFSGSDKTLGPFRVLSMQQVNDRPRSVSAVIDTVDSPLLLVDVRVSEQAAGAMAADRKMFMDRAPHGGTRVFDGDAPE